MPSTEVRDCVVQAADGDVSNGFTDLCSENDVSGYPQLNLYKDGKFVEVFKEARDLDKLRDYIASHAEPRAVQAPAKGKVTEASVEEAVEEHNPNGNVVVLTDATFDKAIQDGHIFVKFYAPWFVLTPHADVPPDLYSWLHAGAGTVRNWLPSGHSLPWKCAAS